MFRIISILGLILALSTSLATGADSYKKYDLSTNEENLLKISFSNGQTILTFYDDQNNDNNETIIFSPDDVKFKDDTVFVKETAIFCSQGFFSLNGLFLINDISNVKMETDKKGNIEIFLTQKSKTASKFTGSRSKNRVGLNQDISVETEEFVRGSALSFWSNIKIDGEVSGNVIALFGDIDIGDKAIVRGNVLALNGNVNHAKNSTIYGEIRATNIKDKHRFTKTWRVNLNFKNLTSMTKFYYNRVDGAAPYFGYKYLNSDSTLPEISLLGGYAFASERWRYDIGIKQFLLKNKSLQIGGSFYKSLISDDDRIISENENTLFALLVTEDYRDYFEAEGGKIGVGFKLPLNIDLEFNYQIEKYKSLPAHSGLWSLFGGSKEFRPNFSSLGNMRELTMSAMNNEEMSSLGFKLSYNKNGKDNYPYNSFTTANLDIEWTPSRRIDQNESDFTRYLISASRYQTLDRKNSLIFKTEYGNVDGDNIPTHKAFFLGGLGTLHGYDHKEFAGVEYWLGSINYRIKFPAASWDTWLFYEVGQIANYFQKLSKEEVKNSIGIGLSFTDSIRLNISKRLDRSKDTMKLYVRLKHQF